MNDQQKQEIIDQCMSTPQGRNKLAKIMVQPILKTLETIKKTPFFQTEEIILNTTINEYLNFIKRRIK